MWLVQEMDSRFSLYSLSPVKGGTVIRYRTTTAVGQAWVYLCTLTAMWDPGNVLWSDWGNTILSWSYPDSISCLLRHLLASNPWSIKHILAAHLGLTTTVTMAKSITITADVFCQNKYYQVSLNHTWQWRQFGFGGFCFYKCCTPELQYQEFFGGGGCSWLLFNKRLQFALICMVVVTFSPGLEQLHFSDFVLPFILYKMKTAVTLERICDLNYL